MMLCVVCGLVGFAAAFVLSALALVIWFCWLDAGDAHLMGVTE